LTVRISPQVIPKQQIGFYDFVVKPMFEALDLLLPMEQPLANLDEMCAAQSKRGCAMPTSMQRCVAWCASCRGVVPGTRTGGSRCQTRRTSPPSWRRSSRATRSAPCPHPRTSSLPTTV
jgi:hypothetical protein